MKDWHEFLICDLLRSHISKTIDIILEIDGNWVEGLGVRGWEGWGREGDGPVRNTVYTCSTRFFWPVFHTFPQKFYTDEPVFHTYPKIFYTDEPVFHTSPQKCWPTSPCPFSCIFLNPSIPQAKLVFESHELNFSAEYPGASDCTSWKSQFYQGWPILHYIHYIPSTYIWYNK